MLREKDTLKELSIASHHYTKERDYWLNKLSGELMKSSFPYDYNYKTNVDEPETGTVGFDLSPEVCSGLIKLSNSSDYTVHVVLTAVAAVLLGRYSGNNDIIVGMPIYRQDTDDEFVNTIVALRNHLQDNHTFKDLLLQVRQTIIEADENQNYAMETLLHQLGIPFPAQDFPLFDVVLLLENIHDRKYIQHIHVNMIFSFQRREDSIKGVLEYNSRLYRKETSRQIVAHFTHLLERFLADVNLEIAAVDFLSEKEKRRLLLDFNDTTISYPDQKTIVELFAEQMEKTPGSIAVAGIDPGTGITNIQYISYNCLNQKSNQLARVLRAKGTTPDALVGIMVDRTIDTVIGIAAVLKAGGAYLPIDPETPSSRIKSILEDASVSIVLAKNTILGKFIFTTLQGLRRMNAVPLLTPPRPPIKDLDRLPFPDRSLVDYGKYNQYIGQSMAKNIIVIQASRGCPYHCAYCHKIWPKKQVFRSAEHILSEVQLNYDMGIRKFAFVDDIFNLNRQNSVKFFQLVIEKGLDVQFYFPNGLRGDILTKDYIDLMVEAGTVSCALALETASPRLQKLIHKNLDLEKFRENIEYLCHRYPGVILELFTMHGFPSETEEEALMTLNFIKSLKWVHFPYINMLKIYPNTGMEQLALQHGITRESILRSENFAHFEVSDNSPLEKNFTLNYRSDFLYNYFLLKERLLHVLPRQMKILTEDEIVQKYNSYLPTEINRFEDLLKYLGINEEQLGAAGSLPLLQDTFSDFSLKWKERSRQLTGKCQPAANALRILLLDLSQFFTGESDFFYDVMGEAPLGMMYLLTYLDHQFGSKIKGKIAKSRIDFDSYLELKALLGEFQPDVIGLRSLNIYKDFFHKTIAIIRQWGIDVPVIAGGPYPTSDLNTVLQDRNVDLVVLGEGEITFAELIRTIMNNNGKLPGEEELKKIQGIAFIPGTHGETKAGKYDSGNREVLMSDALEGILAGQSKENLIPVNRSTDLAYSIFTSGSTGTPKGVMIGHSNVHNLVMGLNQKVYKQYGPDRYLKVGMVSPFVFDASVKQIFAAILQGHGLFIVPEEVRVDGRLLYEYYRKHCIDVADGTPAHISILTEVMEGNSLPPAVRHFLIGGEALSSKTTVNFFKGFPPGTGLPKITNVYGPTECTVDVTAYDVPGQHLDPAKDIPIGAPMPNSRAYIVDSNKKPVPLGVTGELCIAGANVGRGYLNQPELTAEKFEHDLWDYHDYHDGNHRSYRSYRSYIYRSGDLARWLSDGDIEFLGRIDNQVKIRGFRIELEDIEKQLHCHKDIKEAVVAARENSENDKYLCAYIVGKTGKELEIAELREYLSRVLPGYMIPDRFVHLQKIPLTGNGKVDLRALPEPGISDTGTGYQAPRDTIEEKLVQMWSDVLKIEPESIGIDSDFFQIGGHSLRATILTSKIHKAFDTRIPLQIIFKTPTVRGISDYIKNNRENKDAFVFIKPVEKKDYYPLSSAQHRLYVIQQMDINTTNYNSLVPVLLEGDPDPVRLREVFRALSRRHESLRASFEIIDGEPKQKISRDIPFTLEQYRMKEEEAVEFVKETFIKPFDLSKAPLFRVGLVKVAEKRHILVVSLHNIIADGTSMGILMKEFMYLYEGEKLPLLRLSYAAYSRWQNSKEQKELVNKQEQYWLKQFEKKAPKLNLPTDFPRPALRSFEGSSTQFRIDKETTREIKKQISRENVTLYMFLLAVFNVFLAKITGQEDILVGTPVANRRHNDLQTIVGMFVNILVMRNFPKRNQSFRTLLGEIKKRTSEVFDNQDYKLEDLLDRVIEEKDLSRNSLFDVSFSLQNMEIPVIDISSLRMSPIDYTLRSSRFDLVFVAHELENEDGAQINVLVEYCTKIFRPGTIQMFIKNFNQVIASVLENMDILLKDIGISSIDVESAPANLPPPDQLDLGF